MSLYACCASAAPCVAMAIVAVVPGKGALQYTLPLTKPMFKVVSVYTFTAS